MFVVNHTADQPAFMSHFPVTGKAEALNPKAQAFFKIALGIIGIHDLMVMNIVFKGYGLSATKL